MVCMQSAQQRTACGSVESDPPFPFPPRGKPGRGKVPPTPRHVPRQLTTLTRPMLRLPPQEGLAPPLRHPPTSLSRCLQTRAIAPGKKNKDGRHVGLDFYDLLIEGHLVPYLVLNNIVTFPGFHAMVSAWEIRQEFGETFRHLSSGGCRRRDCWRRGTASRKSRGESGCTGNR